MNRGVNKKSLIWKRTAVTGAIMAAMAAPLIVMPTQANADLASAVETGSYGPVVTIVSPQYADVVKGNSISIEIAVQQRTNPVKALQMFVDDHIATPGWVPLKSLQSSKFNWDTTLFTNGPHKLSVRVADAAGLIGQAQITVYVNNANQSPEQNVTAPTLKWLGIQNGQVLKGVVDLQLQASANFGVKYIFVMLNSVTDPDRKPALRSWMINQPPYTIPFDTTKVNDGAYVLDALAYDALSNQGEASRLNIGIANNTINPTYFSPPTTELVDDSPSSNDNTKATPSTEPASSVDTLVNKSSDNSNKASSSGNSPVAFAQTIPNVAPFQPGAPTRSPQQAHDNAADFNDDATDVGNSVSNDSLKVETVASAQLQRPTAKPQPRVTALPVPTKSETAVSATDTLPKTTLASPSLFASMDKAPASASLPSTSDQPRTTMASSPVASTPTPKNVVSQSPEKAAPVREAKLPPMPSSSNAAIDNSLRQISPVSTIANTQTPASLVTETKFIKSSPQRYFQVNDAYSVPLNSSIAAPVKTAAVTLPEFPQASWNPRSGKTETAPRKSTFTTPTVAMTKANVTSRMTQANSQQHVSPQLMANAQIGTLPGVGATRTVSSPQYSASSRPLFTTPDTTTMASSRIATANISGQSWGYQNDHDRVGQSTKPQMAFLPKFNATPKQTSFAAITISPSTKMQVSEMSQSWPAIYQAKRGEQLSTIADRYGLPVEVLAKNNGLQKGAKLTAGQEIKMPRNLQVTYNGKALHSDVSSMLVGTTSVAAFRFLFEQQGGKVTWDSANQTVHAKNGDKEITLTIGSDQAMINQKTVMMDMAAFLLSGRTMVPVRFFEKSFNAHVTWEPSTGRMLMAMAG